MVIKPINIMILGSFWSPRLVQDGSGFYKQSVLYTGHRPDLGRDNLAQLSGLSVATYPDLIHDLIWIVAESTYSVISVTCTPSALVSYILCMFWLWKWKLFYTPLSLWLLCLQIILRNDFWKTIYVRKVYIRIMKLYLHVVF